MFVSNTILNKLIDHKKKSNAKYICLIGDERSLNLTIGSYVIGSVVVFVIIVIIITRVTASATSSAAPIQAEKSS